MPDIVLVLLKFAFLGLLYIFVARAVRAVVLELRGGTAPARASAPAPARGTKRAKKRPAKAVIVEGSSTSGKTFNLKDELILGRGEKCHVILDDTYVSTVHARLFPRSDAIFVEDLGSTNGTYLNRKRVTNPMEIQRGDQVKIGKTVLEMRK
ncbi:MAG: FHA domain-containing protein [Actinomycetota bacterium]|nr:FHA domain-containing protein [Actinomycetota bacterium]